MYKSFKTYSEAYALYSDIVSNRDPDRKNASILLDSGLFFVYWEKK